MQQHRTLALAVGVYFLIGFSQLGFAQSASILKKAASQQQGGIQLQSNQRYILRAEDVSLFHQVVAPPRVIKVHDILTVAVSAQTEVIDEGEIQRRKNTSYRATLADWILLRGLSARPDPMSAGDLTVNGTTRSQYRATSELETANSIKFRIAVEVSEIRPNGLLVIQGQDQIKINGDLWERNLMGEVSPENVLPNGEIQSEKIYKLKITKTERGIVRDGYRRGWFAKFLDDAQPF